MQKRRYSGIAIHLGCLILILFPAVRLQSQSPAGEKGAAKHQAYVIPFSHLDLFWAGTEEECLARGNRIIARALEIARAHPEFRFLIESDNFLANYVESHKGSSELEELKRLVKEGRIAIAPNSANIFLNMPDGEVLTRNILYGKQYARDVFGVNPLVMHPTDIPGFPWQYPQILEETGTPFMVESRMGPEDKSLFNWLSPEGSKELVWSVRGYGLGAQLQLHGDLTDEKIEALKKELNRRYGLTPWPVYIHWGIDLWAPTEKLVENIDKLNRVLPDWHFTFATPQEYYNVVAKTPDLPKLSGEIPMGWPHVVDGILQLWQLSTPATNALTTAEEFSTINYALGYAEYPQREFAVLWKKLIESMDHNHDGQGGEIGDNRKMEYSQLAIIRGGEILRDMLRNIAERVQNPIPKSFPLVVFSGLGFQRSDLVKAHMTLYGDVIPARIKEYRKGLRLVDENGEPVPFYLEQTSDNISRALDLIFLARDVPSLGYKTYYLTPAEQAASLPAASRVTLDRDRDLKDPRRPLGVDVMENDFYRVAVDKATGGVAIFDKQLNRDVVRDMQIAGAEERGTNNVQAELNTGRTIPTTIVGTALEENNTVRTVLKISGWMADIPITQRLILYQGLKRLDIENSLDWKEPRMIRIEQLFPVQQSNPQMFYGVPFGAQSVNEIVPGAGPRLSTTTNLVDEIDQKSWEQYRMIQGWTFAGNSEWGVTVAADHQLVRLENGMIHANMIRGQRYTSVKIVRGDEVASMHFPPRGHYVFKYSLSSGPGGWQAARSYQAGLGINSPLIPVEVVDEISTKSLPPTHSFCSVQGDNLVISALKKSESEGAVILRLYEIQGTKAETPITFLGKPRIFRETNLLEQELGPADQKVLRVNPYQIKTVKLQLPK
ncbi:MAG TPA: glycosyl hydrolase-related protein [Terriglobia bacterium]|nr:glycosyl hydrolase-related protein [Terriglobia bacterium]